MQVDAYQWWWWQGDCQCSVWQSYWQEIFWSAEATSQATLSEVWGCGVDRTVGWEQKNEDNVGELQMPKCQSLNRQKEKNLFWGFENMNISIQRMLFGWIYVNGQDMQITFINRSHQNYDRYQCKQTENSDHNWFTKNHFAFTLSWIVVVDTGWAGKIINKICHPVREKCWEEPASVVITPNTIQYN